MINIDMMDIMLHKKGPANAEPFLWSIGGSNP